MSFPARPFYVDLESALEQIREDGCDYCHGDVEVTEVPSDRNGLYAEIMCLIGGTEKCFDRIQKVRI